MVNNSSTQSHVASQWKSLGWVQASRFQSRAAPKPPSFLSPAPFSLKFCSGRKCEFIREEDRGANSPREGKEVWGKVIGPDWGGSTADKAWGRLDRWQPFIPASSRIARAAGLALLSQPRLPPPRKQAACARVNTIQVINCLQQLAPAPGPADTRALKEGANYSIINIHATA